MEKAYLAGGCFWCIEALYQRVKGVELVVSGYAGGGSADSPTYRDHGNHAETVEVTFDPKVIDYETIVAMFWSAHNPTTLNRQGNDVGPAYRSIILTTSDEQQSTAEKSRDETGQPLWDDPIVTEIRPLDTFSEAEDYHQDYFNQNPNNPYCQVIINPKLAKFKKKFAHLLK